jgi:hypothetical protein
MPARFNIILTAPSDSPRILPMAMMRQTEPIDHGQQALASDGLPAGLRPRNGFPAGLPARRATETVPRAPLARCETTARLGEGRHQQGCPDNRPPWGFGQEVSQGHKPDKPDKLFSSACNGENGLFSHARGERFVRLVRLQQLLMGCPDENRGRVSNHPYIELLEVQLQDVNDNLSPAKRTASSAPSGCRAIG